MTTGDSPSLLAALRVARDSGEFRFDRPLDSLPVQLRGMPQLHSIILQDTHVGDLPEWLIELPTLASLSLSDTSARVLPLVVPKLHQLRHLAVSGLRADALFSDLTQLVNLETLVLTSCGLLRVPDSLPAMTRLRTLDLSCNALDRGSAIELPTGLTYLALWGTGLRSIPPSVGALSRLRVLLLSAHGSHTVSEAASVRAPSPEPALPRIIGSAGGPGQGLTEIPDWLVTSCRELTWLDLAGNRLTTIPDDIVGLPALRGIVLTSNLLTAIPDGLLAMPSLEVAALEHNQLTELPSGAWNLERLAYVGLVGNPLSLPPEILGRVDAPTEIWEFLTRTEEDTRPLDEAKLLIVGEASVGKSSIIRRLVHGDFNPDERTTEGIEVSRWVVPVDGVDTTLNVWDFGGQEIMHATHQFFLTRRSLYVLVLNARQGDEQNRVEYWLKIVESFSDRSPVIVVGNKCEDRIGLDIDRRGLRAKYPSIVGFVETSCLKNTGIVALRRAITATVRALPHVRDPLPTSFFEVKADLEGLGANYLLYSEYEKLCEEHGIDARRSQELLISFLHDVGTVLCFRNDPRLRDTNILNPSWVTGGVYLILNAQATRELGGLIAWSDIDEILERREYPADRRGFIVEMMRKFELCYESDGVFLIPDLLTKQEPDTGSWDGALSFTVKYDILPPSVIGRLLVRMSHLISKRTVWRTGAVLAMDRNRALVKADREAGLLTVLVAGPPRGRRGLLTAVRTQLAAIGQTIPGLAIEERVPVPGHAGIWVPLPHLLRLEEAGRETVVPQGLVDEFRVRDLLDGVGVKRDLLADVDTSAIAAEKVESGPARSLEFRAAIQFGVFLVVTLLAVIGAVVVASQMMSGLAVVVVAAATVAVSVVGLFVLAAAGVLDHKALLAGLKLLLGRQRSPTQPRSR